MAGDDDRADLLAGVDEWALEDGVAPPPDDLFKALAGPRRVTVLSILLDDPDRSVDELTDIIVGSDTTVAGPAGPDEWAQVKIELVHAHLPLLADVDLVDYDGVDDSVRLKDLAPPVERAIRYAEHYERFLEHNGLPTSSTG